MSGPGPSSRPRGALALRIWLIYAAATISAALAVLAVYVNAYDDYDVGPRLRGLGGFAHEAMLALSFPLGWPVGALLDGALSRAFGCGAGTEPCAVFVSWQTHFAALVAQIALLRWLMARRRHEKVSPKASSAPP